MLHKYRACCHKYGKGMSKSPKKEILVKEEEFILWNPNVTTDSEQKAYERGKSEMYVLMNYS